MRIAGVKLFNLSMGGTDNLKTSIGHNWQQGPINAPTVLKFQHECCPVLGWSRRRSQGTGRWTHRKSG